MNWCRIRLIDLLYKGSIRRIRHQQALPVFTTILEAHRCLCPKMLRRRGTFLRQPCEITLPVIIDDLFLGNAETTDISRGKINANLTTILSWTSSCAMTSTYIELTDYSIPATPCSH